MRPLSSWPHFLAVWTAVLLVALHSGTSCAQSIATDRGALVDLYWATSGNTTWRKSTNWLSGNASAPSSVCSWFGVACAPASCSVNASDVCRVVALRLASNKLVGSIPPSLGLLDSLQILDLSSNQLASTLPESIGNLAALTSFTLAYNKLVGVLPASIGRLGSLQLLDFTLNKFVGEIPPSMSNLSALVTLKLRYNKFFGSLPQSLGLLGSLRIMNFASNQLSGEIPSTVSNLSALETIDLSSNQFSGDLGSVSGMSRLARLNDINFSSNNFTGPVPVWILNLSTTLVTMRLSANRLSGVIPAWLGEMRVISILDLARNSLSGTIPSSLAAIPTLTALLLGGNAQVSGEIPYALGASISLQRLEFSAMNLSGVIPHSFQHPNLPNLLDITLSFNRFSGSIPEGFWRIPSLERVMIMSNRFSGTISDSIRDHPNIAWLRLEDNMFSGTIPDAIGSLRLLYQCNFSANSFSGPIPSSIGNLSSLNTFSARFNQLSGSLPESIGLLASLEYFDVRSNQISGRVPNSIPSLGSLLEIDVGSNRISGLPSKMCLTSSFLTRLDFSDNLLRDVDLPALLSCPNLAFIDLSRNRIQLEVLDFAKVRWLPPLINLSRNELGPILAEYTPFPQADAVATIDIRHNRFFCPLPSNYPIRLEILFSTCAQPWPLLAIYAGIFAGSLVVLGLVVVLAIRYVPIVTEWAAQAQMFSFVTSWVAECAGLILDALTLQLIIKYLLSRIDHCNVINSFPYFGPLTDMQFFQYNCLPGMGTDAFPPTATFSQFLASCQQYGPNNVPTALEQFQRLCRNAPQCDFDPVAAACRTFRPELASDPRGDVHTVFFAFVIATAAVRAVIELARVVCVLVAYRRMSNLAVPVNGAACIRCCCVRPGNSALSLPLYLVAELVGFSPLSPLLYVASRAEFTVLLVQREASPADLAFRALYAGLLTSLPLLFANLWYLLRVTQYGLAPPGWLSLMKGFILIPRLLFQAYRAARPDAGKHRRSAPKEGDGGDLRHVRDVDSVLGAPGNLELSSMN
jgi:Leucine-rich repeat (LRR) protein